MEIPKALSLSLVSIKTQHVEHQVNTPPPPTRTPCANALLRDRASAAEQRASSPLAESVGPLAKSGASQNVIGHKLKIPTKEGLLFVDHDDLVALRASGSYTWVIHGSGDRILVSRTMCILATGLPGSTFFRCHRSSIINLMKVEELQRHGGYRVLLQHGLSLAVARSRWAALLAQMELL